MTHDSPGDGSAGRLPLTTELAVRPALVVALLLLAAVGVGILIGHDVVIGLALGFALVGLVVAFVGYLVTRRTRRVVDAMAAGDHFIHWIYAPDDWKRHLEAERKRGRNFVLWGLALGAFVGGGTAFVVVVVTMLSEAKPLGEALRGPALLGLVLLALCLAIGAVLNLARAYHRRQLLRRGGRVYIGRSGLYIAGDFWPSRVANPRFLSLRLEEGPPLTLLFEFHVSQPKGASYTEQVRVPVPSGREADAGVVQERVVAAW